MCGHLIVTAHKIVEIEHKLDKYAYSRDLDNSSTLIESRL
jgi:hypothetical protein